MEKRGVAQVYSYNFFIFVFYLGKEKTWLNLKNRRLLRNEDGHLIQPNIMDKTYSLELPL